MKRVPAPVILSANYVLWLGMIWTRVSVGNHWGAKVAHPPVDLWYCCS